MNIIYFISFLFNVMIDVNMIVCPKWLHPNDRMELIVMKDKDAFYEMYDLIKIMRLHICILFYTFLALIKNESHTHTL